MLRVNELLSWLTWLMLVEGQRSRLSVWTSVRHTQSECLKLWRKLSLNCISSEVPTTLRCDEEASERSSSSGALLSTQPDHEAMFTLQRLQITDDVCRFESWRWCNAVVLQEFTSVRSSSARVAAAAHHHPVRQTQTAELDSSWQIHHYIYL